MHTFVLSLEEINQSKLKEAGGKALNLGKITGLSEVNVPPGFCVKTNAFQKMMEENTEIRRLIDELADLKIEELGKIRNLSSEIRSAIETEALSPDIAEEIISLHLQSGIEHAYAVRSSATTEDLPHASFAGQQDTYLNVIGREEILNHVVKCWASLFTERAVMYRIRNGFDHRLIYMSVIVQQMVIPEASGIMFTADPVTSNRKVLSIDASFGLGEALVSGIVSADNYQVREHKISNKKISTKKTAICALKEGGTDEKKLEPEWEHKQVLTNDQIFRLAQIGRTIETSFDFPQDIEWCIADDTFYILQSRPITTLYPLPAAADGELRVYMSMGHQQMMTAPIKPLGMSFFKILSKDFTLQEAGGRLFVDFTHDLASPIGRKLLLNTLGKNEPLMKNSFESLIARKDFMKSLPHGKRVLSMQTDGISLSLFTQAVKNYYKNDPAIIHQQIALSELSLSELKRRISRVSGEELFDFILEDHIRLKNVLYDPRSLGIIMAGLFASYEINSSIEKWLGEKNAANTLSQSVLNNVTSEMGLALLDVADAARDFPEVLAFFEKGEWPSTKSDFFRKLSELNGGQAVCEAMETYLEKFGMRCSGEIDITRTRWLEDPSALVPMMLSNIKNFEPGASADKIEQGRLEAERKERDLLIRLKKLPGGARKAAKMKKVISVLRHFTGYREYPKYAFISRYFVYKERLLEEAGTLVDKGILQEKEDIYYLTFDELREAVRTHAVDRSIISGRKQKYEEYDKLRPPRIITSEGECLTGELSTEHFPQGAVPGIAVSSGVIEGRARVVLQMEDADIEEGDILITPFTDPSWTPLFVSIKGLVTEVGGLMTHGAVIAREYGLPAVVGVENATLRIKDGQRIRVNGSDGYIEIL
ncbi:phosphoenolpyruvate synthase [Alteribacillus sp. HJP-4]|uniref:phosphoenolpyruvate synthase n=1 Tax=Alteribacillus sp. HJP-4 TaxID=2775394 RepID=UPI0035CCE5D7